MTKAAISTMVVAILLIAASSAEAQSTARRGYRRYSFSPAMTTESNLMAISKPGDFPPVVRNSMPTAVVRGAPMVTRSTNSSRSYRRYSYSPSGSTRVAGSGARKQPWQYMKTDPQRYNIH